MKTSLQILLAVLMIGFIVSCQKNETSLQVDEIPEAADDMTGESLPMKEFEEFIKDTTFPTIHDQKIATLNLENDWDLEIDTSGHARSRYYYSLPCGYYNNGTTIGETNTANYFPGPDAIYYFTVYGSRKHVDITLSDFYTDHDIFLTEGTWSGSRLRRGTTIATSLNPGTGLEHIGIALEPGTYFVVVDAVNYASDFKLQIDCAEPIYSSNCEGYDDLSASYSYGISRQSRDWKKWRGLGNDGKVLHESYSRYNNKVVKFDHSRFGYQDVVRRLTNYHIVAGAYSVEFDMYITSDHGAKFVSEKLSRHGAEQGFQFHFHNGQIDCSHRLLLARSRYQYPSDRWFKVKMDFDMNNDRIYVRINDNTLFILKARGKINSYYDGIRSIWGLDFFANQRTHKFHIDNFCVKNYFMGWIPGVVSADDIIDMTR